MTTSGIRMVFADSGQTSVSGMINFIKQRYNGLYNPKEARIEAKELVSQMKPYL